VDQPFRRGLKNIFIKNNFWAHEHGSKKLEHPTVISPQPSGSSDAITPEKGITSSSLSVQGRQGGDWTVAPRLSCPDYFIPPKRKSVELILA